MKGRKSSCRILSYWMLQLLNAYVNKLVEVGSLSVTTYKEPPQPVGLSYKCLEMREII